MKITLSCLALGAAFVASVAEPVAAANWTKGTGGNRGYGRAAVPVPVPAPVPDYAARWYFRTDVGLGLGSDPSVTERGIIYGNSDPAVPVGTSPAWFNEDFETFVTWGAGVGYHWTPWFRTDLTADLRSDAEVKMRGTLNYPEHKFVSPPGDPAPPPVFRPTGNTVVGRTEDVTTLRSGVVLLNGYLDLSSGGRFTPYVGAGIGVAINELDRTHNTIEFSCDPVANPTCTNPPGPLPQNAAYSASDKQHPVTLAAAAMAGVSYRMTPSTSLDLNYRFLFIGGTDANLAVNGHASRVEIGDMHEHQVRVGVRWDVE
jgi:opacity protein-like surface antigen